MPRNKRLWYPGAVYHVMNRGNRRESIFRDHEDYYTFLEDLAEVKERHPCCVCAVCLMTNHFHLLIKADEVEIWKIMRRLQLKYAQDFNMKYNYTGHVFEKRYNSQLIEDRPYLLEVSRYIHLNPVKAMIVKDPQAYEYSSYGIYIRKEASQDDRQSRAEKSFWPRHDSRIQRLLTNLVDPSLVLSCLGQNSEETYKSFVEMRVSHLDQERLIRRAIRENELWEPQ